MTLFSNFVLLAVSRRSQATGQIDAFPLLLLLQIRMMEREIIVA